MAAPPAYESQATLTAEGAVRLELQMQAANAFVEYDIKGPNGGPWGAAEVERWRSRIPRVRSVFADIYDRMFRIKDANVEQYGHLDYRSKGAAYYPLYCIKSKDWCETKPLAVITGSTHGYETSGAVGAVMFAESHMHKFPEFNWLILPVQCPWGYEHIQRWTPDAVDPNRQAKASYYTPEKRPDPAAAPPAAQFTAGCPEIHQSMACIAAAAARSAGHRVLVHADLHETTLSDNTEFCPAKNARDGNSDWKYAPIPIGFYNVASFGRGEKTLRPEVLEMFTHVTAAVAKVTSIAQGDANGQLVGEDQVLPGTVSAPGCEEGLVGAHTHVEGKISYTNTTEVFALGDFVEGGRLRAELAIQAPSLDESARAQCACVEAMAATARDHLKAGRVEL